MALQFTGEVTCSIGVTSLDRSIPWYEDLLGFKLLYRADEVAWCEFSTHIGKVTVGLSQVETVPQGGGATLTWGVADVEAAQRELKKKGIRMDGDIMRVPGMVNLVTFYDPDGNTMMLFDQKDV
jgi:predicted enzyme related to lactoylglutathione lyase